MSRIRTIKPELLDDDKAAELPHQAWRLMVSVFVLADDHGRIRASLRYLAANVFSGNREGVEEARARLCADRFWIFYTVHGEEYAVIRTFRLHQRIDNAGRPRLPGPEDADEPVDVSDVPSDDDIAAARAGLPAPPRKPAKQAGKRTSAAVRRESPRNAALPPTVVPPTSDPERDLRAREQDAVSAKSEPEALRVAPSAPPVAEVEPEATDAPQPQGEASGAKPATEPPVRPAEAEAVEVDSSGERTSGPISPDAFGAAEVVEIYNAYRPEWLPAFDPPDDPIARRRALDDIVRTLAAERGAFAEAKRNGETPARPGLHTVEGWLAFCARLADAPPIADFKPVPTLATWTAGPAGERMRSKLWEGRYDAKHGPRETAMQRNVREAQERAETALREEPAWVGLLGAGGAG